MTYSPNYASPPAPVAPELAQAASVRPPKRSPHWGLLALSLVNCLLVAITVWTRRDLVRVQIQAQRPRVDSQFMGVATASGLVAIFLGLVVALLVVQLLARYADRRIARLRDPDGDSGSVTARSAAGLTTLAALGSYLMFSGPADSFGSGVPFWSVPLLAVLAHVPDAAKWRASATAARVVSAAAALAFPVCVLVAMGR